MRPLKQGLEDMIKFVKVLKVEIDEGNVPLKLLRSMFRLAKGSFERELGMVPLNLLTSRRRLLRTSASPSSAGTCPERKFVVRCKSVRTVKLGPKVLGIPPVS
jgi:hypothetical protein